LEGFNVGALQDLIHPSHGASLEVLALWQRLPLAFMSTSHRYCKNHVENECHSSISFQDRAIGVNPVKVCDYGVAVEKWKTEVIVTEIRFV
jgi:hypothetical protein